MPDKRPLETDHPETTYLTATCSYEACSVFTRVAARTLARSPIRDLLHRRLQPFCCLHDCSGCFRLERLPGGACTHWKAPPLHGAHVTRGKVILDTRNGCQRTPISARSTRGDLLKRSEAPAHLQRGARLPLVEADAGHGRPDLEVRPLQVDRRPPEKIGELLAPEQ
jgi:hypothetical protein